MRGNWNHEAPEITQPRPEDNTSYYVKSQVQAYFDPEWRYVPIHPESAMEVAAWYHGPDVLGITAFSHSGTITETLIPELIRERGLSHRSASERMEIDVLIEYIESSWSHDGRFYARTPAQTQEAENDNRTDDLIRVSWNPRTRAWHVSARSDGSNGWNHFDDAEDQLDTLLSIARDVATGG